MADGDLLNVASKQPYIFPAMYDIDGALELVTGDVAGKTKCRCLLVGKHRRSGPAKIYAGENDG